MGRRMIFILGIAVCALLQNTNGQKVHVVGNELGWTIPPGGSITYDTWASLQDFNVGDILSFNFTNGEQDVVQVTKESFKTCNTTNPIWSSKNSPANFTLSAAGEYYFTSTIDRHCVQGQRLAIYVHGPEPAPAPCPEANRGPVNYTVGGALGWIVPPAGDFAYAAWAHWKIFLVGDTLVFYFTNGTQDVAVVTKEVYDNCDTNNTIAVYKNSPTYITLNTSGEHFYTSTYSQHCALGQKLAINVTTSLSPGTKSPGAFEPSAFAPSVNSAPSKAVFGFTAFFLSIAMAFPLF